eukprot:CAMPEP_0206242262 /NCGR_PEP_ID=MMETSP0047_2-20121206/16962_1 /ASSEMBLY_ACC=CAM_ASM_000192 /TAXON_ID=195065 /ORGANISM="Chroomonas mesostigmatica_cf, Strain CCMP1168" /LENGTH=66 /DNA_ID=CAMNT_0053667267 /DNA_START=56 /DNA_END=252 /DNA_ORIENTATION=-
MPYHLSRARALAPACPTTFREHVRSRQHALPPGKTSRKNANPKNAPNPESPHTPTEADTTKLTKPT